MTSKAISILRVDDILFIKVFKLPVPVSSSVNEHGDGFFLGENSGQGNNKDQCQKWQENTSIRSGCIAFSQ